MKGEIETDDDDGGERERERERESRREDRREAHRCERGDRDRRR